MTQNLLKNRKTRNGPLLTVSEYKTMKPNYSYLFSYSNFQEIKSFDRSSSRKSLPLTLTKCHLQLSNSCYSLPTSPWNLHLILQVTSHLIKQQFGEWYRVKIWLKSCRVSAGWEARTKPNHLSTLEHRKQHDYGH